MRQAIADANSTPGNDVIVFETGVTGTIQLAGPLPELATNLVISGPGAYLLTVRRSTGGEYSAFRVGPGAVVTIDGLTISNGFAPSGGGGIFNEGILTVRRCILRANTAANGGGIFNSGELSVLESTLSDNEAITSGGGLYSDIGPDGYTAVVSRSTVSGNRAGVEGGGIFNRRGPMALRRSTVTANSAPLGEGVFSYSEQGTSTSVDGSIVAGNPASGVLSTDLAAGGSGPFPYASQGFNIVGGGNGSTAFNRPGDVAGVAGPGLGPLAANGGPTPTHRLLDGPAVDIGGTCGPTDQRGAPAPFGLACDAGAFEGLAVPPPVFTQAFAPTSIPAGTQSTLTFTITNHPPGLDATALAFSNTLPAGLVFASPANVLSTCEGVVSAPAGGSSLSLVGGRVAVGGACTVSVQVLGGEVPGLRVNVTGELTSSSGSSGTAAATLTVTEPTSTPPPLAVPSFTTGPNGTVTVSNTSADAAVGLSCCTAVAFDGYSEEAADVATSADVLAAGDDYVYDLALPAGRPGAVAVVEGEFAEGAGVLTAFGRVVAAVVYDETGEVYVDLATGDRAECGNGGGFAPCDSEEGAAAVVAAMAALFGQRTGAEVDGPVDLAVSARPNPSSGRAAVAYGVAGASDVRVAVYDALGREVAVLAAGPHSAGRHEASLDAAALPTGVYVVRVSSGAGVHTARVTVAR